MGSIANRFKGDDIPTDVEKRMRWKDEWSLLLVQQRALQKRNVFRVSWSDCTKGQTAFFPRSDAAGKSRNFWDECVNYMQCALHLPYLSVMNVATFYENKRIYSALFGDFDGQSTSKQLSTASNIVRADFSRESDPSVMVLSFFTSLLC